MINIRYSCFETNSSSMHSIAILSNRNGQYTKEEIFDEISSDIHNGNYVRDNNKLQYNREPKPPLYTFKDKLDYALANSNKDTIKYVLDVLQEFVPTINNIVIEHCGRMYEDECYGYVDEFIIDVTDKERLRDFLINKNTILILDGDEYNFYTPDSSSYKRYEDPYDGNNIQLFMSNNYLECSDEKEMIDFLNGKSYANLSKYNENDIIKVDNAIKHNQDILDRINEMNKWFNIIQEGIPNGGTHRKKIYKNLDEYIDHIIEYNNQEIEKKEYKIWFEDFEDFYLEFYLTYDKIMKINPWLIVKPLIHNDGGGRLYLCTEEEWETIEKTIDFTKCHIYDFKKNN